MRIKVSSAWAGKYAKTKHGFTSSLTEAAWWFVSWSVTEYFRVLKLNKYHFGNILGVGKRLTDPYGNRL